MTDLNEIYQKRQNKIFKWLNENNIFAAVWTDDEDCRDVSIRYLCGHPSDAVLILTKTEESILIPWDEILAEKMAYSVNRIIPLTKFKRNRINAVKEVLNELTTEKKCSIQIPVSTKYLDFMEYKNALSNFNLMCTKNGVHDFVTELRAVKDEYEIECTKKACSITNEMTEEIIAMLKSGKIKTEIDVALFAERQLRIKGCEKTSFDTLAAGPDRSFAIHAFPGYTKGNWGCEGLSILDYGVSYEGYASDCTITIAKGKLTEDQKKILDSVQIAADECQKLYMPGKKIIDAVHKADEIFEKIGRKMPHGLGHGTGLEIHEAPFISSRAGENDLFIPRNIITLEPGLYDAKLGGCRLENDVLITETGNEILTASKIFYID